MIKTIRSTALAGLVATVVALLLPAANPSANANLPVNLTVNPLTMMADSMRTVTTALDAEIKSLVASASEATEIIDNGAFASSEARWIVQRLRELRAELPSFPSVEDDAFHLTERIAMQQRIIEEIQSLVDQRNAIVEHMPTMLPTQGRFSSEFGYRVHPISGGRKMHKGIDIAAQTGTEIHAASGGTVVFAGVKGGYGNVVEIDHGFGYLTRYAHASRLLVKVGDAVSRGQLIALVGSTGASTGAHLHFEVMVDSVHVDPLTFLAPQISAMPELADATELDHPHVH